MRFNSIIITFASLFVIFSFSQALAADSPAPVRMDQEKMAGLGLTAVPPDAYIDILVGGELNMKVASLFEGEELRASIFSSTPADAKIGFLNGMQDF